MSSTVIRGAGLGLRKNFMEDLLDSDLQPIDFLEIAPENWCGVGGQSGKDFRAIAARYPLVCHGLSLSLGGFNPLNEEFILQVKHFLKQFNVTFYTEHLSYATDHAYLYDLLPMPFTSEAVMHVAKRIRRVQEILERRIAVENISYYTTLTPEMSELEFTNAVLAEADCDLHLDVNNIYVNSLNHGYNASEFLANLHAKRVVYIHVAGHDINKNNMAIDTHGDTVIKPVWNLLNQAYQQFGILPTLLERDANVPPLADLLLELNQIRHLQKENIHDSVVSA